MELVFVALPVALVIGGAALVAFVWAARDDQFEDLDTPPRRAIFDELPAKDATEAGVAEPAPTEASADSRQLRG
jgi:cbb3-type cytochrome oxidase maturation protein